MYAPHSTLLSQSFYPVALAAVNMWDSADAANGSLKTVVVDLLAAYPQDKILRFIVKPFFLSYPITCVSCSRFLYMHAVLLTHQES